MDDEQWTFKFGWWFPSLCNFVIVISLITRMRRKTLLCKLYIVLPLTRMIAHFLNNDCGYSFFDISRRIEHFLVGEGSVCV